MLQMACVCIKEGRFEKNPRPYGHGWCKTFPVQQVRSSGKIWMLCVINVIQWACTKGPLQQLGCTEPEPWVAKARTDDSKTCLSPDGVPKLVTLAMKRYEHRGSSKKWRSWGPALKVIQNHRNWHNSIGFSDPQVGLMGYFTTVSEISGNVGLYPSPLRMLPPEFSNGH